MGFGPLLARTATIAGALALFAGSLVVGQLALADGQEGRRVAPPRPPQQQQETFIPTSPDIAELAGGNPPVPTDPCLSLESAYLAISQTTQGSDMASINAALAEVESDPTGIHSDPSAPSLANRLRVALGLAASAPPCETVLTALRDSVQLAQLASAAEPEGPITGGIGDPPPTSPSYGIVRTSVPGGSRGHGYCVNLSSGCRG